MKTQGEIEAAVAEGIARFEQEYMGREPKHIHAATYRIDRLTFVGRVRDKRNRLAIERPT